MPLSSLKQGALTDVFSENAQLIEDAMHIPLCEDSVKRDLTVAGKPARIYFVDGMIDNERIAHYVLMPCMQTPPRDLSPELPFDGSSRVKCGPVSVNVSRRVHRYSDAGWYGEDDPKLATKEWGQEMLQATEDWMADFLQKFEKVPFYKD